jgi:uncharacterized protein (DUF111 family)
MQRIKRFLHSFSKFMTQLGVAVVKAVVMSMFLGVVVVSVMHYMGVPVPSTTDLLRGVSRLAHILS